MNNVKDIISAVRCHKGFTHARIAKELGIALTSYQSYERGVAYPPIKVLSKLADIYGLTTDQLIGRSPITKQDMESLELPISKSDLKAFTMAAMQGLISGLWVAGGVAGHGWTKEEIAKEALDLAQATLEELSKTKQPAALTTGY